MSDKKQWRFESLDSWFFREARAFDTSGSHELISLFPPSARTVAGAVRTLIGETQGVDWEQFAQAGECADLKRWIGVGDDLGALKIVGPYPLWKKERWYPAPLHLLGIGGNYVRLQLGEPVECDLGNLRLPTLSAALPGAKPLNEIWLNGDDLQRVLRGEYPEQPISLTAFYNEEPRVGLARNNTQRTAADGLLYQTRHIRPRPELAIGVTVSGIPPAWHPERGVIRFGGEGRASAVTVEAGGTLPAAPKAHGANLLLMLLTPADFGGGWLLPGFQAAEQDGVRVWRGTVQGVALTLHSAVLGKAVREGGWNLLTQQPRPVRSLIPAGSVYFCTVAGDAQAAIEALHGQAVGREVALGRGELAVGFW